jgi:hypothetical protein
METYLNSDDVRPTMDKLCDDKIICRNWNGTYGICENGEIQPTFSSPLIKYEIDKEKDEINSILK